MSGNQRKPNELLDTLASAISTGRGLRYQPSQSPSRHSGYAFIWDDSNAPISVAALNPAKPFEPPYGHHFLQLSSQENLLRIAENGSRSTELPLDPEALDSSSGINADDLWAGPTASFTALRLLLAAHEAISNTPEANRSNKRDQLIEDISSWLEENLHQTLRINHAAEHFRKSPRQLIRILKESTGAGFTEHLIMHRMIRTREMMMRTDDSVIDVARACGFRSREQFIRTFSKTFGWTPLQFRKAWTKATLSRGSLDELCRIPDRIVADWDGQDAPVAEPASTTLVVANSTHDIAELFSIDPGGKSHRLAMLERGGMIYFPRVKQGARWLIRTPQGERGFATPATHSLALANEAILKG